jgi:hypothetical protein
MLIIVADHAQAALGLGVVGTLGEKRDLDGHVEVLLREPPGALGQVEPQAGVEFLHVQKVAVLFGVALL